MKSLPFHFFYEEPDTFHFFMKGLAGGGGGGTELRLSNVGTSRHHVSFSVFLQPCIVYILCTVTPPLLSGALSSEGPAFGKKITFAVITR